ncbi:hypothetical protein BKA66DRAFT_570121 [Pyrenochaeta sp. MPI-SDFR-AT-0127]|nr:hypothetical protein BKA66DRAFT_570121 [Pyrenochaeta sp. MPI-SDFR-AT-0127]
MTSLPTPHDSGHRFAPITADNASGQLWIASILCLIYGSLVLIVRLHIKWKLYGADDITVTVATFLQLGEVIPLFIAMKEGLGLSHYFLDALQVSTAGKATFVASIFLILSIAMAKASVAALMLRLFPHDISVTQRPWVVCHATILLTLVWAIGSIVGITLSCSPSDFIRENELGQCHNRLNVWRIIAAFDMFIELLLLLLPIAFIWPIQLKRHIKLQVAIAFGFRVPIIAFAAMHLHYVSQYANSTNVSKAIIPALVCQQFELLWSLLSATVPTLKAFMKSFNSGFGMEMDSPYGYKSRHGNNGSYPLASIQRSIKANGASVHDEEEDLQQGKLKEVGVTGSRNRPARSVRSTRAADMSDPSDSDTIFYQAGHHEARGSSVTSDGSQEMIIKREVKWTVSYEDRLT